MIRSLAALPGILGLAALASLAFWLVPGQQVSAGEHWAGSGDFAGFTALVELTMKTVDGPAQPFSVSVFGTAPNHYEFPLAQNQVVQAVSANGDQLSFRFRFRGREYDFAGSRTGDVMSGRINGEADLRLYRLGAHKELSDPAFDLTGIYEGQGTEIVVTPREFGGLRAVDLATGENMTLLAAGARNYFTWQELQRSKSPRIDIRFPKNDDDEIVAMVQLTDEGHSRVYRKSDGITQKSIEFRGAAGKLAGTLLVPRADGPLPGVVLVHGSGPIYRSALLDRGVFLAKLGMAVLIYDKRGTGASEGSWQSASFEDLAADALAALARLEEEPDVKASQTGFQGHSQAGYVIPIAAALSETVDFAIIVNGGSVRPDRQSLFDKENDLRREGFSAEESRRALDLLARMFSYVIDKAGDPDVLERDFLAAQSEPWFGSLDLPRLAGLPRWQTSPGQLEEFRRELAFDPIEYQRAMKIPVLVILGEQDETVPAELAAEGWRRAMKLAGNDSLSLHLIPGAGHAMRSNGVGKSRMLLLEYRAIHKTWLVRLFDAE